jgi:hypothetical protein
MGIKPIHPNGWLLGAVFWLVEIPLMFAAGGTFGLGPFVRVVAGMAFLATAIGTFGVVFSRLKSSDD